MTSFKASSNILFVDQLGLLVKKMQFLHKYDAKYSFKSIIALKHQVGHDPSSWPADYQSSDPSPSASLVT
jgi:hypothetical protein